MENKHERNCASNYWDMANGKPYPCNCNQKSTTNTPPQPLLSEEEIKELRIPYEGETGLWVLQTGFASFVAQAQLDHLIKMGYKSPEEVKEAVEAERKRIGKWLWNRHKKEARSNSVTYVYSDEIDSLLKGEMPGY